MNNRKIYHFNNSASRLNNKIYDFTFFKKKIFIPPKRSVAFRTGATKYIDSFFISNKDQAIKKAKRFIPFYLLNDSWEIWQGISKSDYFQKINFVVKKFPKSLFFKPVKVKKKRKVLWFKEPSEFFSKVNPYDYNYNYSTTSLDSSFSKNNFPIKSSPFNIFENFNNAKIDINNEFYKTYSSIFVIKKSKNKIVCGVDKHTLPESPIRSKNSFCKKLNYKLNFYGKTLNNNSFINNRTILPILSKKVNFFFFKKKKVSVFSINKNFKKYFVNNSFKLKNNKISKKKFAQIYLNFEQKFIKTLYSKYYTFFFIISILNSIKKIKNNRKLQAFSFKKNKSFENNSFEKEKVKKNTYFWWKFGFFFKIDESVNWIKKNKKKEKVNANSNKITSIWHDNDWKKFKDFFNWTVKNDKKFKKFKKFNNYYINSLKNIIMHINKKKTNFSKKIKYIRMRLIFKKVIFFWNQKWKKKNNKFSTKKKIIIKEVNFSNYAVNTEIKSKINTIKMLNFCKIIKKKFDINILKSNTKNIAKLIVIHKLIFRTSANNNTTFKKFIFTSNKNYYFNYIIKLINTEYVWQNYFFWQSKNFINVNRISSHSMHTHDITKSKTLDFIKMHGNSTFIKNCAIKIEEEKKKFKKSHNKAEKFERKINKEYKYYIATLKKPFSFFFKKKNEKGFSETFIKQRPYIFKFYYISFYLLNFFGLVFNFFAKNKVNIFFSKSNFFQMFTFINIKQSIFFKKIDKIVNWFPSHRICKLKKIWSKNDEKVRNEYIKLFKNGFFEVSNNCNYYAAKKSYFFKKNFYHSVFPESIIKYNILSKYINRRSVQLIVRPFRNNTVCTILPYLYKAEKNKIIFHKSAGEICKQKGYLRRSQQTRLNLYSEAAFKLMRFKKKNKKYKYLIFKPKHFNISCAKKKSIKAKSKFVSFIFKNFFRRKSQKKHYRLIRVEAVKNSPAYGDKVRGQKRRRKRKKKPAKRFCYLEIYTFFIIFFKS